MKSVLVLVLCVAAALAAPANPDADAVVLEQESDNIGLGNYRSSLKTSNGISQSEEGELINVGTENEAVVVRGQFSYTGPDGVIYTVNYVADANGFQAQGAHLPQAPSA